MILSVALPFLLSSNHYSFKIFKLVPEKASVRTNLLTCVFDSCDLWPLKKFRDLFQIVPICKDKKIQFSDVEHFLSCNITSKISVFITSKPPNANFSIRSSLISLGCDLSSERLGNMKFVWMILMRGNVTNLLKFVSS